MVKRKNQTKSSAIIRQAQRVGIFGASGCGKTTKARELTANLSRLIYFDPLAELATSAGITGVFSSIDRLKIALKRDFCKGFRFDFIPTFGNEIKELNDLCYFLLEVQSGYKAGKHQAQITLFVDELDIAFPSGITQRDTQNGFAYLCRRGRHYGINLIGISQRPHQVDICFRGNCSGVYWFRHAEPSDIDVAARALGKEYRETLRNLGNYQYIYKSGGQVITKLN